MARLAGGRFVLARLAGTCGSVSHGCSVSHGSPGSRKRLRRRARLRGLPYRIAADYRQDGMGRSLFGPPPPTPSKITPGTMSSTCFVGHALLDYSPRWRLLPAPMASRVRRQSRNLEESKIDYVIGSGNHSRSYLHRTARGTFIELPLSWYSEKGGTWGMSPAFDSLHPLTRRIASYECVFCHTAYPRIAPGHDAPDSEPIFAGSLPEGIDCQRCHGPGGGTCTPSRRPGRSSKTSAPAL